MMNLTLTRRHALLGGLALPAIAPSLARAAEPIPIGTLTPLTGAGGAYGPGMAKVAKVGVDEINAAGGVLGRPLGLYSEDDETNPDSGVKAAHKLIDIDHVVAICGTWASAVTTAVAPVCWESKTMLFTVSGADSITKLPHMGYIIRTQPNSNLQATRAADFMASRGVKSFYDLSAQTPFAKDVYQQMTAEFAKSGGKALGNTIYDASKTNFRAEVEKAVAAKPQLIFLNSYAPDLAIILRNVYQAGFSGPRLTLGYAATPKVIASLPKPVTDGLMSFAPSPDPDSPGYKRVKEILGAEPDPYACQIYDHISLAALAMAQGKAATAQAIHDNVRAVGDAKGEPVTDAIAGLKAIAAGKTINYSGASGPCKFDAIGDILGCKFRFDLIKDGKDTLLSIS
jgi:branched-chain amino acid transport system substrate-binding protein